METETNRPLRVLVACEYSGTVRDAFLRAGHDAMSCDLLPTESPGPHYRGDVFDVLEDGWDLMVAHPPCTYLTNAGNRWLYETPAKPRPGVPYETDRWHALADGAQFLRRLLNAPIPRVAVENPKPSPHAVRFIGRGPDQIVQPWQFGHMRTKGVGLWLRNLPPLVGTEDVHAAMMQLPYAERAEVHSTPPGKDRAKKRSMFFRGIADAMANQWGVLPLLPNDRAAQPALAHA